MVIWWLLNVSRFGFYARFVDTQPEDGARPSAFRSRASRSPSALLSGAISGVAGFVVSAGIEGRMTQSFFLGYTFSGILIAFLARNDPLIAILVAAFVGVLFVAGQSLQVFYQIPCAMVQLIQAIIVISVAASEFFIRHRIHWVRGGRLMDFLVNWVSNVPGFAVPYRARRARPDPHREVGRALARRRGLMLMGAIAGVGAVIVTGEPLLALVIAALAAAVISLVFAGLVVALRVNQVIAGLAMVFLCQGLTSLIASLEGWSSVAIVGLANLPIPASADIPVIGRILFAQDSIVYLRCRSSWRRSRSFSGPRRD